jgi:class 3 adenylate cyclase
LGTAILGKQCTKFNLKFFKRNFTDTTEVLQEGIMVFVNEIAEIIHSRVDYFSGAPNKNVGDAFLLVWKFPKDYITEEGDNITLLPSLEVNSICELSIIAFVKVQADINKSTKLEKYRTNQGLIARLKNPEYRVRLGMGLHLGWAIEGAIGSEYKIDASYLSPNVNMASRLEEMTKTYGVNILIR